MAGHDETHARDVLAAMQERLIGGPASALGVPGTASAAEVRQAFLALTKTYHPARFARMAIEVQKLSNEVFLSLRAAHDTLAKSARSATAKSSGVPVVPAAARAPRPGASAPPSPPGRPTAGVVPPRTAGRPTADGSGGVRRAASGAAASATPTNGVRVAAAAAPGGKAAAAAPPTAVRTDDQLVELLQRGQWDAAKGALEELAARAPTVARYQALLCYARGREAQLAQRLDEARVELMDALRLDPELQLAKTALGELFTRRK